MQPEERIITALRSYIRYYVKRYPLKNAKVTMGINESHWRRMAIKQRNPGLKTFARVLAAMTDDDAEKLFKILKACRKHNGNADDNARK